MKIGKVLVTADEIAAKLAEMGKAITNDYRGKDLLMVGILKGAFVVMADLSRRIDLPLEFDFMAVSSYGASDWLRNVDTAMTTRKITAR